MIAKFTLKDGAVFEMNDQRITISAPVLVFEPNPIERSIDSGTPRKVGG
jgi:hypothetical protein